MPRRALRKLDPALDLSFHLKSLANVLQPGRDGTLFQRDAPLEVEVGSGKGLFLQSAATANPDHNFLGIEIAMKYARFAAARLAINKLPNALVIHGDAQRLFSEFLPNESLAAVHVYFPDPWWKKRHHKRRVMNESFVRQIDRTLTPKGALHFWTDVRDRFEATLQLIAANTSLAGPLEVSERPAQHNLDYRTHFERRMRLSGQPVYRAEFRKTWSV
ncbi:MAG TPA: tRNA (guanosine(46)-N7)-methyltransferase TrmB [Lacipirellulaceae bacterium]|nr:tRNA (guanosine(46)-N7)-methyltransferase TrmB [Lacipirellulaceae bacterium]